MNLSLPAILKHRRVTTDERVDKLISWLVERGVEPLLDGMACVYATGSVARGEASEHSDLDLFIVSRGTRKLSNLASIKAKARLIEATESLGFPPFSGDGEYLEVHQVETLVKDLGTRDDDYHNSFTARMLLLLESRSIIGSEVYGDVLSKVIGAYWRDFEDHDHEFSPIFLINDIIRYWKSLCLSYESHGAPQGEHEIAKRRLRNYKLKYARLLTCYSAVLYLCWLSRTLKTITPADARAMADMKPLQRLERIDAEAGGETTRRSIRNLLELYARFLQETDAAKAIQIEKFGNQAYHEERRIEAREFGDEMYRALTSIGADVPMFRFILV